MPSRPAYELIDFGGGARLERFGERLVDRPHPEALGSRIELDAWRHADLRFDRDRGWTGPAVDAGGWTFEHAGLTLELRPTEAGQVGLFPEHLEMLAWLRARVGERAPTGRPVAVLHLFAYTGLATLALAAAGAEVTHVDASRPTVAWARRNAELSGMTDRPIRWIVDDAVAFTQREARRRHDYAGIVLDPPTYGHGPGARPWRLEDDLARLLAACGGVLEPDGFVLLTAHTPEFDAERLSRLLDRALGPSRGAAGGGDLAVAAGDGRRLELGAFVRRDGRAS
jgi:23S rRNA (cytosine1962-C5)-methyltransferase